MNPMEPIGPAPPAPPPSASPPIDARAADEREFIAGWSWAGAFLNWVFLLGMRQWVAGLALLALVMTPRAGGVIGVAATIYLGIRGRSIAWRNRPSRGFEDYRQCMTTWDRWAIVFLVASVALLFATLRLGLVPGLRRG
jgi:hypothetical protein